MPTDGDGFILDTDACDLSIGAVLSQVQGGAERVIAYASQSLSRTEKNYGVTKKELLAVVYYTRSCRQYLLGWKFPIITDHSALKWLRKTPELIGQQARWCEILEEFDFQIVHRPGRNHSNADAFSRRPCRQCGKESPAGEEFYSRVISFGEHNECSRRNKTEIVKYTELDPEIGLFVRWICNYELPIESSILACLDPVIKSLHAQWERFAVRDGILYRRFRNADVGEDGWQVVHPVCLREEAMLVAHASVRGGHMGVKKTQSKIAKSAYWVGWANDVRNFCRRCDPCARYHRGKIGRQGELQPMCLGGPWERVAVNITGPHPLSVRGNWFILTVLDYFTKYAFAFPIRSHDAHTVAKYLVEKVFLSHEVPLQLLSDRGIELESSVLNCVCKMLAIDKIRTTSYKPSTNGALDCMHRTLNAMISKVVCENQRDWDAQVAYVMSATLRTTPRHTVPPVLHPNVLLYGRELTFPHELLYVDVENKDIDYKSYVEFVEDQRIKFRKAFTLARVTLGSTAERKKKRYDMRVRTNE